jgi:hypothetical protein
VALPVKFDKDTARGFLGIFLAFAVSQVIQIVANPIMTLLRIHMHRLHSHGATESLVASQSPVKTIAMLSS